STSALLMIAAGRSATATSSGPDSRSAIKHESTREYPFGMRGGSTRLISACIVASGVGACSARPLPEEERMQKLPRDAGTEVAPPVAAGDAGGAGPRPATTDWGIPIGSQPSPAAAGATTVKAVIPTDDGGAIVAGSFTGMVAFASDVLRDGTPGSGF